MSATSAEARTGGGEPKGSRAVRRDFTFFWLATVGLLGVLTAHGIATWEPTDPAELLVWGIAALLADLMVVRFDRGFTFSMSMPVTLAAAMTLGPAPAGLVAFLGCLDPIEIRGGSALSRALFNRAQVACATVFAGVVFQGLGVDLSDWPLVLVAALLALSADFLVNGVWTLLALWARHEAFPRRGLAGLFGSVPTKGGATYLLLGLYAPVIALAYSTVGGFGLTAAMVPLVLARGSLRDSEGLAHVAEKLSRKDQVIRESLGSVASERREERRALAGALHDEVLPAMFKVHLMGQVIRQDLASGRLLQLEDDVPELLRATEYAQSSMRKVVAGLRDSTLGPSGARSSLQAVADHLGTLGAPPFQIEARLGDVSDRALLVGFQIAREAMTNAAKHAKAASVDVRIWCEEDVLRVAVVDDGVGFDPRGGGPAGHFGLQLMRERVEALGGTLVFESRLGRGTAVLASIPAFPTS